ncbi:HPr kinase/phosphorylase [BD1-7 clade bacterium]|uniref:HPr kinase/phosphorylase n=1 Tax=BD1-7 clade bacterium TaxID=2029982 RepID=A0A5S9PKJ9_9GAMM|nr:HPr kinase/phosphorylase [BD1-7 clade bacterium]
MTNCYSVFGLSVTSDWNLPLNPIDPVISHNNSDVTIRCTNNLEQFQSQEPPDFKGDHYSGSSTHLRLSTSVAEFLIVDGRFIYFKPLYQQYDDYVRLFILGSAFAALLEQRSNLVLHAATVVIGDKAVLLMGKSGAGKSTLAAYLARQGFTVLGDDVAVIRGQGEQPYVYTSLPFIKLNQTSLALLDLSSKGLDKIHPELSKYRFPIPNQQAAAELAHIVYLDVDNNHSLGLTKISGSDAVNSLRQHYFRHFYSHSVLTQGIDIFKLSTVVLQNVSSWSLRKTNNALLRDIKNVLTELQ